MAFKDVITFDETAPVLPSPSTNAIVPEAMGGPGEVEEMFNPAAPRPPAPDPMQVEVAQAAPPSPTRSDAVQNIGQSAEPEPIEEAVEPEQTLISPDDTRYKDAANVLIGDVILGGALPWLQAAADLAAGRITGDQYDAARMEHQRRIEELRGQHPEFVSAAENAAPFLAGLGISIAKPARTIVGAAGKGMAAAAPIGAVQGYTGGPIEEPSASGTRIGGAVGRAAQTAVLGAAGAAGARGVQAGKQALDQRAATKTAEEAKRAASEKRAASALKTKKTKESTKFRAQQQKAEEDQLADLYETYKKKPTAKSASKDWKANREKFEKNPVAVYRWASKFNDPLDALSRSLNQPPIVIAKRLKGKELPIEGRGEFKLYEQLDRVNRSFDIVNKRSKTALSNESTKASSSADTTATSTPASKSDVGEKKKPSSRQRKPRPTENPEYLKAVETEYRIKSKQLDSIKNQLSDEQYRKSRNELDDKLIEIKERFGVIKPKAPRKPRAKKDPK